MNNNYFGAFVTIGVRRRAQTATGNGLLRSADRYSMAKSDRSEETSMHRHNKAKTAEINENKGVFYLIATLFVALALLCFMWAAANPVHAQSFNCRYAKLPAEVAICKNPYLGDLDEQMASIYFSVRRQLYGNARKQLERDQKYWLKGRNRCGYNAPCIEDAYNRRIYQLSYNY